MASASTALPCCLPMLGCVPCALCCCPRRAGVAVPLVNAWAIPDHILRAPIGILAGAGVADMYKVVLVVCGLACNKQTEHHGRCSQHSLHLLLSTAQLALRSPLISHCGLHFNCRSTCWPLVLMCEE